LLIVPIIQLRMTVFLLPNDKQENAFYFNIFSYLNMSMNFLSFRNCGE
jgi:hypothetical protein